VRGCAFGRSPARSLRTVHRGPVHPFFARTTLNSPFPSVFLTFEGGEGCGKSTQIQRLAERLRKLGCEVVVTREPGGTEIGEQLRHLLQFSKAGYAMSPETELLLFAASRAQLVRELIQPALDRGAIVLADRFLDSTTVYQGVARHIDPAEVAAINHFAVGACMPALTFLLDLAPAEARVRLARRQDPNATPDRMESQPAEFYEAVRRGYVALAAREPNRIRLLDATESIDALESRVWQAVEAKLAH
jgi:dTMP kinase